MQNRKQAPTPRLSDLLALVKPGIVLSNTLTALGAMALVPLPPGVSSLRILATASALGFGVASLVAGSCALNNWLDRDIDALMHRTKDRPTVDGRVGPGLALGLGGGLLALGVILLALDGPIVALLGIGGALVYLFPYTLWIKRRSGLSSLIGGVAGALPPLIGWAALDPSLSGPALLLFLFLILWQQAHVRALALRREKDFVRAAVPMPGLGIKGDERPGAPTLGEGGGLLLRQVIGLLIWILALLPLPFLVAQSLPPSTSRAFAVLESLVILAWLLRGLFPLPRARNRESLRWGSRMFFSSLLILLFFFAGLLAAKLLGSIA